MQTKPIEKISKTKKQWACKKTIYNCTKKSRKRPKQKTKNEQRKGKWNKTHRRKHKKWKINK